VPLAIPSYFANDPSNDFCSDKEINKMLNDISAFVSSEKFKTHPRKQEILLDIKRVHIKCTQAKFKNVSRKHLLSPNSKKDSAIRDHFKKKLKQVWSLT
jgi:protein subunit release factor A